MLETGTVIDGKYKILSQIGQGGMSTVYLAMNEKANKPWAVKEVRKNGVQNFEIVRQSLITETDLLKKHHHKNLPSIVDIIDCDDNFLIVMDYIEGVTLDKLISEQGPQKQEDVVSWAIQLCDVLTYLHTREPSIIYRDMKPSNIMLRYDGSVVLIDFGTAREYKTRAMQDTTCLGTQGYAAPEQFGGQGQTDARTDIYCLGATMYHLLTGHNPSEPPYEMYPITYWNPLLSGGLEQIIQKCTQKNPRDRFQTAKELMYALQNYKDLDAPMIRKYRRNLTGFFLLSLFAVICGSLSFGLRGYAANQQKREYNYLLDAAQKTGDKEEKRAYYLQAVETDSKKAQAYRFLIEDFVEDGSFSTEEEKLLLQMSVSTQGYFEKLEQSDSGAYADLCFQIGNAYWFYYEHSESRQSLAVPWYTTALHYYRNMEERAQEEKRCQMYIEIGSFYKKLITSQAEGTDKGMYGAYWRNLMELKRLNDDSPDRELVTLRLYEEIVTRSLEYAKYMQEDGISEEEIRKAYDEIETALRSMSYAGSRTREEAQRLEKLLGQAEEMLRSSYRQYKM